MGILQFYFHKISKICEIHVNFVPYIKEHVWSPRAHFNLKALDIPYNGKIHVKENIHDKLVWENICE